MNHHDSTGHDSAGPAIILVRPQLGMNIGMVARAMGNFALDDLRLVAPRDGWPNPEAGPTAAGADDILRDARLISSVAEGLEGCRLTFATTARPRHCQIPVITPREAATRIRTAAARGIRTGVLFGPERTGLTADDLAGVDAIITCPVNPGFRSLNLAQAVLLFGYEWFVSGDGATLNAEQPAEAPASYDKVDQLVRHLVDDLEESGYFHVPERTPATVRSLHHMLAHAKFTADDVQMLHGIIRSLAGKRHRRTIKPE